MAILASGPPYIQLGFKPLIIKLFYDGNLSDTELDVLA
ncbi:hypothetical protein LRLP16767_LRLP167_01390 [Limosilactobacillus reuteri]|uniref:Uncharacterized protein n=1 Tax=Limosilactobacillus reuteri TaxID=1598 RepID=A0A0U5K1I1_LIMRT|nr:hypothetical protein LRLP16767_LRLP167_01390 [Limosilactobacillus reuteri]